MCARRIETMTTFHAMPIAVCIVIGVFFMTGAAIAGPAVMQPQAGCSKEGDPGFYVDFGDELQDVTAGNTFCWTVSPCNFGFVSGTCQGTDTLCVHMISTTGWIITGDPPLGACTEVGPGYLWWQDVCVTVPCDAEPGERDTLIVQMTYCDETLACRDDCTDCEDPNWYDGNPYYSIDTVIVQVVPAPPALYILQDTLFIVEGGQSAAYVPFTVCNGDPCADPVVYEYEVCSTGHVGSGFPQSGATDSIPGGECEDVYAIVNASMAPVCAFDTLTIIAWDQASGTVYDTCVQIIHAVENCCIPFLTPQVITIMAVLMVIAAAVMIRRRFARGE